MDNELSQSVNATDTYHPPGFEAEPMPVEVAIASTLIPYSRDDERARYLGYLACGFAIREALHLINRSKPWLSLARRDATFVDLETRIPEIRKELSKEYIELEFYRNFRLILEKDYRILWKSLNPEMVDVILSDGSTKTVPASMPKQDHDYLVKIRAQYTPQQLQVIEAIASGKGDGFNFAQFVASNPDIVQLSRTDTVTVQKGQ
jgi:hypothetical protein